MWAPDYVELEEVKAFLGMDDDDDNARLARNITTASRLVDREALRQFGSTDGEEQRVYSAIWSVKRGGWIVECDDFHTVPSLVEIDTAGDGSYSTIVGASAFVSLPYNAPQLNTPWERIFFRPNSGLTVTGREAEIRIRTTWGWQATPVPLVDGLLLQLNRLYSRRNSPYGIAGSPDSGSELRLLTKLDPDVVMVVRPYKRRVGAR